MADMKLFELNTKKKVFGRSLPLEARRQALEAYVEGQDDAYMVNHGEDLVIESMPAEERVPDDEELSAMNCKELLQMMMGK